MHTKVIKVPNPGEFGYGLLTRMIDWGRGGLKTTDVVVIGIDMLRGEVHCCPPEHVEQADSIEGPWTPYAHGNATFYRERGANAKPVCTAHVAVDTGMRRSWCSKCDEPLIFEGWEWRVAARREA